MTPLPPDPIPVSRPDSTSIRPAPPMPEYPFPSFIQKIASRPLFKVRTWLSLVFGGVAWVGSFLGVPGLNVNLWAGDDLILTVGELAVGLAGIAAGYFTKHRKPGTVDGVFTTPKP